METELIINSKNVEPVGNFPVPDALAEVAIDKHLLYEVVVYYQALRRGGNHATKGRSDVVGSRRKLFRQKGTGNARQGDIKAPHRRGGGVVHGPHVRSHAFKFNRKQLRRAFLVALASKLRSKSVLVIEDFELETGKTKDFATMLKKLGAERALIVADNLNQNLERASRNLPGVRLVGDESANTYDLLRYPWAVFSKRALENALQRVGL